MLGQTFYHETLRKCVVGFGTLFNDIHIVRRDSSGNIQQSMKVPLAYGPKQKFLTRLREDPSISKSVAITLPRIGFEIGAMTYDSTRKLNKIQKVKKSGSAGTRLIHNICQFPTILTLNFMQWLRTVMMLCKS